MTGDRVRGKQLHDLADHKERRGDHSFHAVLAWWFVVSVLSSLLLKLFLCTLRCVKTGLLCRRGRTLFLTVSCS